MQNIDVSFALLPFTIRNNELHLLLHSESGKYRIIEELLSEESSLQKQVDKKLRMTIGTDKYYYEQLYTFDRIDHMKKPHAVVAYLTLISEETVKSEEIAPNTKWFSLLETPAMELHEEYMVKYAQERLQNKIQYSNIAYGLLPEKFSLSELQKVYEVILQRKLDKRNFRKKMQTTGLLKRTKEKYSSGAHRPAQLFTFRSRQVLFFD